MEALGYTLIFLLNGELPWQFQKDNIFSTNFKEGLKKLDFDFLKNVRLFPLPLVKYVRQI